MDIENPADAVFPALEARLLMDNQQDAPFAICRAQMAPHKLDGQCVFEL